VLWHKNKKRKKKIVIDKQVKNGDNSYRPIKKRSLLRSENNEIKLFFLNSFL